MMEMDWKIYISPVPLVRRASCTNRTKMAALCRFASLMFSSAVPSTIWMLSVWMLMAIVFPTWMWLAGEQAIHQDLLGIKTGSILIIERAYLSGIHLPYRMF